MYSDIIEAMWESNSGSFWEGAVRTPKNMKEEIGRGESPCIFLYILILYYMNRSPILKIFLNWKYVNVNGSHLTSHHHFTCMYMYVCVFVWK